MKKLADIILSYIFVDFLFYVIYFLSATVFILFAILIVHKLSTEKKAERKKEHIDKYNTLLNKYLGSKDIRIKQPENNLEYDALSDVCIDSLSKNSEEIGKRVRRFIKEETFLIEHYKKMASSSSWLKRFIAVEKLGFFMIDDLKEFFIKMINEDPSPEVKAKAVWGLSLIADEKGLKMITDKLSAGISQSSKFNEYIFTNVIHSFRKKGKVHVLITFLNDIRQDKTIPYLVKRDMIEACGSAGLHEAERTINDYFSDYRNDVLMKVACIRALGRIADSGLCDAILTGLGDTDWRVRAVSARAASICPAYALEPQLFKLLYDSIYFVRINAAKTLARLGNNGLSALKIELNSQDRFVRDTVRYILEEKGIHA